MVDVTRRRDYAHDSAAAPRRNAASSSGSTVRRSQTSTPSSTRAMTSWSRNRARTASESRAASASATPTDGIVRPGSDPPPATASVEQTSIPGSARAMTSARDCRSVDRGRGHPPQRDGGGVTRQVCRRHRLEERERELVGPHCASERVAGDRRDQLLRAHDDPSLRAAQQLVAGEGDERRARIDGLTHAGFVVQPRRPVVEPRCRLVEQSGAGVDHHRRDRAAPASSTGVDSTKPTMR